MMMVVMSASLLLLLLQRSQRLLRVGDIAGLQILTDLLKRLRERAIALRDR
jgi:hypothetical protein